MGILYASGLEMVLDGQLRYTRGGLQCFLRAQNFQAQGDWQEVGVSFSPTGTALAQTGFTDILIDPPPAVTAISSRDIGLSGGRLQFGARKFFISNTFVSNMMDKYQITDPYDVFRNWDAKTPVIGIVYDNRMFSIVDPVPREIAGERISWTVTANYNEIALQGDAAEVEQP
jgi:hypothetical protein